MRLLNVNTLELEFFDRIKPHYAAASHRWGDSESSFQDVQAKRNLDCAGYRKIQCFAAFVRDHVQNIDHLWIDTCCIDKTNSQELQEAITAMYKWYQGAAVCLVYLDDVQNCSDVRVDAASELRQSLWFTRGWTLQELLAPSLVVFLSTAWGVLGHKAQDNNVDRASPLCRLGPKLNREVADITHVPELVLAQAERRRSISVDERLGWMARRTTTRPEDMAYSLLGLFDVSMPLIYEEGRAAAERRLKKAIEEATSNTRKTVEDAQCFADLCVRDPQYEKQRIEELGGGLVKQCYQWIFVNPEYEAWSDRSRLLWISGGPGQGKTMLLCGVLDHLLERGQSHVSYFLCQKTDNALNNAISVLRGILFTLCKARPDLLRHVRKEYDNRGKSLFEDANAWFTLRGILTEVLSDVGRAYIVIDALDECVTGRDQLLRFILHDSAAFSQVKWMFTSRRWPEIETPTRRATDLICLHLTPDMGHVEPTINTFVEFKVNELAQLSHADQNLRTEICTYLSSKAGATFLWVALVCQSLHGVSKRHLFAQLNSFNSPELDETYNQIITQIERSRDAEICMAILATIACSERPLRLAELAILVEGLEPYRDDLDEILDILQVCYSLVTLIGDKLYFIHQSAQEHVVEQESLRIFSTGGQAARHREMYTQSVKAMTRVLRQDIYDLRNPGIETSRLARPTSDPLAPIEYSCIYWIHHLLHPGPVSDDYTELQDASPMHQFLSSHLLHWLEALGLLQALTHGIDSLAEVQKRLMSRSGGAELGGFVRDALRFVRYFRWPIDNAVLQLYSSALLFSPNQSPIRKHFSGKLPPWITDNSDPEDSWGTFFLTLEDPKMTRSVTGGVTALEFLTPTERILASGSPDGTITLWDWTTGQSLSTLENQRDFGLQIVRLSSDGHLLATTTSSSGIIKLWDWVTKQLVHTIQTKLERVHHLQFSPLGEQYIVVANNHLGEVYCTKTYALLNSLGGGEAFLTFSADRLTFAKTSHPSIEIYNILDCKLRMTLPLHAHITPKSIDISADGHTLALSTGLNVSVWDLQNSKLQYRLQKPHGDGVRVREVFFVQNGKVLVTVAVHGTTVLTWSVATGQVRRKVLLPSNAQRAVSSDGRMLALIKGNVCEIWNLETGLLRRRLNLGSDGVSRLTFSPNGQILAIGFVSEGIKLCSDADLPQQYPTAHDTEIKKLEFSPNGQTLISVSVNGEIKLWSESGHLCAKLSDESVKYTSTRFSPDGQKILVASADDNQTLVWDTKTNSSTRLECLQHNGRVALSLDGQTFALFEKKGRISLFDWTGKRLVSWPAKVSNDALSSLVQFPLLDFVTENLLSVAGVGQNSGLVEIWDIWKMSDQVVTWKTRPKALFAVKYSPSRRIWVISADESLELWNSEWEYLYSLDAHPATRIQFSPDESMLIGEEKSRSIPMIWQLDTLSESTDKKQLSLAERPKWQYPAWWHSTERRPLCLNDVYLKEPWLYWEGKRVLWLPPVYRTEATAMHGENVAIGTESGRLMTFKFNPTKLEGVLSA